VRQRQSQAVLSLCCVPHMPDRAWQMGSGRRRDLRGVSACGCRGTSNNQRTLCCALGCNGQQHLRFAEHVAEQSAFRSLPAAFAASCMHRRRSARPAAVQRGTGSYAHAHRQAPCVPMPRSSAAIHCSTPFGFAAMPAAGRQAPDYHPACDRPPNASRACTLCARCASAQRLRASWCLSETQQLLLILQKTVLDATTAAGRCCACRACAEKKAAYGSMRPRNRHIYVELVSQIGIVRK
jgi:hypothetical protein